MESSDPKTSGAVLSKENIIKFINSGDIVITPPVEPSAINCASVDLKLSNEFRVFKKDPSNITIKEDTSVNFVYSFLVSGYD